MAVGVLEEVEMHILCLQNTIAQYIVTHPILELCMEAEDHTGSMDIMGEGGFIFVGSKGGNGDRGGGKGGGRGRGRSG